MLALQYVTALVAAVAALPLGSGPLSTLSARLFDADGHDEWVDLTHESSATLGPKRLLWVDVGDRGDEAAMSYGPARHARSER